MGCQRCSTVRWRASGDRRTVCLVRAVVLGCCRHGSFSALSSPSLSAWRSWLQRGRAVVQDRFWALPRFDVAAMSRRIDSCHRSGCFSVLAAVGFTGATIRASVAPTQLLPPERRLDRQVDSRIRRSDFLDRLRHTVWFARSPAIRQVCSGTSRPLCFRAAWRCPSQPGCCGAF